MSNIAIVAIPRADDYVWKISSEKVPHLTLLFLGDRALTAEASQNITQFVEHVAKTTMHRFGLDVDRRGELGDKQADVLFFNKYNRQMLENLRSFLLTNDTINQAYHAADQFPEFTPHLTLGYPDSPAKPDNREHPSTWVSFDRLAVWFDDFDGPEFELTDEWDGDVAAAWSDLEFDSVDDLIHYGVKGMRWGVHRSREELASGDHLQVANYKSKIKTAHGTHALENKELQAVVTRMNLEQQYSKLSSKPNRISKGNKAAKEILAVGATANAVILFAKSPAGKALGTALKTSAKHAAKGATSHTSRHYASQVVRALPAGL